MTALCSKCKINPKTHHFVKFGSLNGMSLYYTSPVKSLEIIDNPEKFVYFKAHLEQAKAEGKWIWIFDCADMRNEHFVSIDFTKNLFKEISENQLNSLMGIWVIHPNTWMRTSISVVTPLFKKEVISKIKVVEGNRLELISNLEKLGITGSASEWLGRESVMVLKTQNQVQAQKKVAF